MSIERPAIHGIRKRTAPVTLSVASDDWLKLKKPTWAKKSYEVEERNLKHLKPALGSLLLIDISAEDIADYQKSRLKANASPKTINDGPECSSRRHHDGLGIREVQGRGHEPVPRPATYGLHSLVGARGVPFRRGVNHGLECEHDRQNGEAIRAHRVRGPTCRTRCTGSNSEATGR